MACVEQHLRQLLTRGAWLQGRAVLCPHTDELARLAEAKFPDIMAAYGLLVSDHKEKEEKKRRENKANRKYNVEINKCSKEVGSIGLRGEFRFLSLSSLARTPTIFEFIPCLFF